MLHQKILQTRKQKGLTQEELADKAGVTTRTIQRIENGESVPRPFTLKAIAAALDMPFEELQQPGTAMTEGIDTNYEDDHHFLQLLVLSCFSYIVVPFIHFLIPGYLLRKKGMQPGAPLRFARKLLRAQVYWVIALNLSMLLTLAWNLSIKHNQFTLPPISYVTVMFAFYLANAALLVFFLFHVKRIGGHR